MCPFNPDVSCSFHTSKSEVDGYCHPDDCVLNNCVGGLNVNELGYLDLVGFSTFLCKLSQRKSMEIITNRGKDRATHVVARMLKSAKKTVRILCSEVNLQQFDILNLSKCLKSDVSVNVLLESISDES